MKHHCCMASRGARRRAVIAARAFATLALPAGDLVTLTVAVPTDDAGKPLTDVRLFKRGWNTTENGNFLFDDEAAASVMEAYRSHGVLLMIDLEHLSLDPDALHFDPRARGRAELVVRDGELWLCGIKWTADAVARITSGEETYLSPAFPIPGEDRRIRKIHNVGLVAQPATDFAVPLAASTNHRGNKMNPKLWREFVALTSGGMSGGDAIAKLAIDPKTVQAMAKLLGVDPNDLGAVVAAVRDWVGEFETAATGKGAPKVEDKPADEPAPEAAQATMSAAEKELATLKAEREERLSAAEKELATLKAEKVARDGVERCSLVAELVRLGRETPATAWVAGDATKPRGSLATMPLEELRQRVKDFGGAPVIGGSIKPSTGSHSVTMPAEFEVDDFEIQRLNKHADATKVDRQVALARYMELRGMAVAGAKLSGIRRSLQMLTRRIREDDVVLTNDGRLSRSYQGLVTLSNPVKPIEEFGASSQRALEEFRLEYNTALASQPVSWAESISPSLPSGALKQTYPISFAIAKYTKKVAGKAPARTANNKDVTVSKDHYHDAEECELFRLNQGDFAYVLAWGQQAARMARARQFLKNHIIATLLEANGTWVDGVAFFATSHLVDPFDSTRTFHGATTWENLEDGTAAPLNAATLTEQKDLFAYQHCGPDGEELGWDADGMLIPTILGQTAKNLLTVQDVILAADEQTSGSGKFGAVSNPHKNSGMTSTRAPELTGTAVTANWYLFSMAGIAAGLKPWVMCEDAEETINVWDETSDYTKDSGFIKYESNIRLSCALLYPHAIRKIQGT